MEYNDIRRRCVLCNRIFVEQDALTIAIMKEFMPDYEPTKSPIPICNECLDRLYRDDD